MSQQIVQFILNHWELWLAFATLVILILINERLSQKKMPHSLTPAEAIAAMNHDHAVVIDLRSKEAFNQGHIIGSIRMDATDLQKLQKYKTTPLLIVCERGIQSNALALKLRKQDFLNTMILRGGIDAWTAESLPTIKNKKTKS